MFRTYCPHNFGEIRVSWSLTAQHRDLPLSPYDVYGVLQDKDIRAISLTPARCKLFIRYIMEHVIILLWSLASTHEHKHEYEIHETCTYYSVELTTRIQHERLIIQDVEQ